MTEVNVSLTSTVSGSIAAGSLSPEGATAENVIDNSIITKYGATVNGTGIQSMGYEVEQVFSSNFTINKVSIYQDWLLEFYSGAAYMSFDVELFYDNAYNQIGYWASFDELEDTSLIEFEGTWEGVSKARLMVHGLALHTHGTIEHHTQEFQCWGEQNLIDIGLRIETPEGTQAIGCKELEEAVDQLRIQGVDAIYGIPLVETTDALAAPIRIQTSAGVKALQKI